MHFVSLYCISGVSRGDTRHVTRSNLYSLLYSNIYGHLGFKHWAVFTETNQTNQGTLIIKQCSDFDKLNSPCLMTSTSVPSIDYWNVTGTTRFFYRCPEHRSFHGILLRRQALLFFLWRFDQIRGHGLPLRGLAITLIGHTTRCRTPLNEWSARRRCPYRTTQHLQETNIHAPCGIEPAFLASEQPQTHALERAAAGIGECYLRVVMR